MFLGINVEIVGFVAGICVAISSLPQIIKSLRTKQTHDLSLGYMMLNICGQILWLSYGYLINSYSLIIMSALTLVFNLILFTVKIKYK